MWHYSMTWLCDLTLWHEIVTWHYDKTLWQQIVTWHCDSKLCQHVVIQHCDITLWHDIYIDMILWQNIVKWQCDMTLWYVYVSVIFLVFQTKKKASKTAIIEMSKEYSIVTQFTSFVAIEERDEEEKMKLAQGPDSTGSLSFLLIKQKSWKSRLTYPHHAKKRKKKENVG